MTNPPRMVLISGMPEPEAKGAKVRTCREILRSQCPSIFDIRK
jgi:hypothetical protein